MKKNLLLVALTLLVFAGCKNDDPDLPSNCVINGFTSLYKDNIFPTETTNVKLAFDSQGRVIKADYEEGADKWSESYQYMTDKIIRSGYGVPDTYTLTNGLITKHVNQQYVAEFIYTDGYLTKSIISYPSGTYITNVFTYSNGNLANINTKENSATAKNISISYNTDISKSLAGFESPLLLEVNSLAESEDLFLVTYGYFGKGSKNLPISYTEMGSSYPVTYSKDNNGNYSKIKITNSDGYIESTLNYTCQ